MAIDMRAYMFVLYYELGMDMLNRRMFQRGKDNNFFWDSYTINRFFPRKSVSLLDKRK